MSGVTDDDSIFRRNYRALSITFYGSCIYRKPQTGLHCPKNDSLIKNSWTLQFSNIMLYISTKALDAEYVMLNICHVITAGKLIVRLIMLS